MIVGGKHVMNLLTLDLSQFPWFVLVGAFDICLVVAKTYCAKFSSCIDT